ncbi:MAG: hypothetical protein H7288_05385 [Kineosporiaceae bacterium]|nr:hypothetical protein [Aeromicrobium sp.]
MTRPPGIKPAPDNRIRETHTNRFTILTVCTANICRSPLMELLLRRELDTSVYEVGSAGIRGFNGHPMDPDAALQAVRFGADPQYFRSRPITEDMIKVSGLILTATRSHSSSVLALTPSALRRTFTLLEFAQSCEDHPAASMKELIAGATRNRSQVSGPIDINDPYRQGELAHQQIAEQIVRRVRKVSAVLNEFAAADGAVAN